MATEANVSKGVLARQCRELLRITNEQRSSIEGMKGVMDGCRRLILGVHQQELTTTEAAVLRELNNVLDGPPKLDLEPNNTGYSALVERIARLERDMRQEPPLAAEADLKSLRNGIDAVSDHGQVLHERAMSLAQRNAERIADLERGKTKVPGSPLSATTTVQSLEDKVKKWIELAEANFQDLRTLIDDLQQHVQTCVVDFKKSTAAAHSAQYGYMATTNQTVNTLDGRMKDFCERLAKQEIDCSEGKKCEPNNQGE